MKIFVRILCALICAAFIVSMPFFISSPVILPEAQEEILFSEEGDEDGDDYDTVDFSRLFFSVAMAEEEFVMEATDEEDPFAKNAGLSIPDAWELPWDFSVPPKPDPACYTENGYEDQSIRVRIETREMYDSTVDIAFVEIASPTQLRTATAYGTDNKHTLPFTVLTKNNNAVVAMNGDIFSKDPGQKGYEVRMTEMVTQGRKRNRIYKKQDELVIDKNGDFHVFLFGDGMEEYIKSHKDEIANVYTFGPALVKDGEIPKMPRYTLFNPNGREPRSAIGQTGPLSYVMVIVEGRKNNSKGVSHTDLANIMKEIGCIQAYNLDGGNTGEMSLVGPDPDYQKVYEAQSGGRGQSDIIYFATAVPEDERN